MTDRHPKHPRIECSEAQALVAGYLDEELSEAQAAPLRQHLLDCHACRHLVAEDKALRAWFVQESEPEVPAGFAARVAQAAFAGTQPGEGTYEHVPLAGPGGASREVRRPELVVAPLEPARSALTAFAGAGASVSAGAGGERSLYGYVLQLTGLAAALLIALSLGLRRLDVPGGADLRADDGSLEQKLERLEQLNAQELQELSGEASESDPNSDSERVDAEDEE